MLQDRPLDLSTPDRLLDDMIAIQGRWHSLVEDQQ